MTHRERMPKAADGKLEDSLDLLFPSSTPGNHFIIGIADAIPPAAKLDPLPKIGHAVEERGQRCLRSRAARPMSAEIMAKMAPRVSPAKVLTPKGFPEIQKALSETDERVIQDGAKAALKTGQKVDGILHQVMIPAMENIGERFKNSEVYIPEFFCRPDDERGAASAKA